MRLKPRTWVVVGLLCCIAATSVWWFSSRPTRGNDQKPGKVPAGVASSEKGAKRTKPKPLLVESALGPGAAAPDPVAASIVQNTNANPMLRYRLRNTTKGIDELTRDDRALLLRNALIDTAAG